MSQASTPASPLHCVVDASVGIKLFVSEDLSDRADALFAQLAGDPPAQFYVPDLFYIECTNILWKYVRRLGHPPDQARQSLADLGALALHAVPAVELMEEAFDLALAHGTSAYDASYVALAGRLGIPLITADERLVRAFDGTAHEVRWLGVLPATGLPTP